VNAPPSINLALMAWKLAQIRMHPFVSPDLGEPLCREQLDELTPCSVEYYHILRRIEDGETP
jgi:hypothetical protein